MASDSQPITRSSLAALMGEPNDLLSESPVFENAAGVGLSKPKVPEVLQSRTTPTPDVEEPLDEHLVNEINDYLQGIMEDKGNLIEMSDSPIKSQGAECVAAAVCFCD